MKLTFQAEARAECNSFLKLEYKNIEYDLTTFSAKYKTKDFDLEQLLPECKILYRNKQYSFDEYVLERKTFVTNLNTFNRYRNEIFPIEISLAITDQAYYQSAKFFEKAEECIQTARYYFCKSTNILEYDNVINWKTGYQGIYAIRAMNFQTALIWYNNCFDYIIQIAFLAFELYKKVKFYKEELSLEEILKNCTYQNLKTLHEKQPNNLELTNLWNIIKKCRTSRQILNDWANQSKHRGGLGFVGLKPNTPFQLFMSKPGEMPKSLISELEPIIIDIDSVVNEVIMGHDALIQCLNDLMDFINFSGAKCEFAPDGKIFVPDKKSYRKIVVSEL